MKRLFHLMIVALATAALASGCEKYDDTALRKEIQDLREKLSSLEAWCSSSQSAIDAVAVLQEAVKNMNSVESVEPFIDADGASGYVVTFTNRETIKLYNGKDGDTFFGNVVVNDDCIIFTLADGRTFTVPRLHYLAFEALEDGATVSIDTVGNLEVPSLEYSTDGQNWTAFDFGNPQTVTLAKAGDKVFWRNTGITSSFSGGSTNYLHFVLGEKKVAVGGNIMSLIDKSCQSLTIPCDGCFACLFRECTSLVSASELKLPATGLTTSCYAGMFMFCSSLESAPELPATELAGTCYSTMFHECISLKKTPALPATELAEFCYGAMFAYCTALEEVPSLPATKMAEWCYFSMFAHCSSLRKAPALPATKLAKNCYAGMFMFCSSLEVAPELPATELAHSCYLTMFRNCTSLEVAPELPATKLAEFCYMTMFWECTSLKKAPDLPATELAIRCYSGMFSDCTSLEVAPELPATKLAEACYDGMFMNCTSLEVAPELPATELASVCYYEMFSGCENLKHIKVGFEKWGDEELEATKGWVDGVSPEGTFECPEGLEINYGASYIPEGWIVNGAAAPASTKSLAAPATESISGGRLKSLPSEISDKFVEPLMLTL